MSAERSSYSEKTNGPFILYLLPFLLVSLSFIVKVSINVYLFRRVQ